MMKILIGYDGSKSGDASLFDLRRAGLPAEAEALIVSVADVMIVPATPGFELAAEALMSRRVTSGLVNAQRHTEHILQEAKDFAGRASDQVRSLFPHWTVRAETLAGPAAFELINKADEWRPDLIVVGSHQRSALSRFVLGSVSKKIVTDSNHSVRVSRGNIEKDVHKPPKLVVGVDGSAEAEHAIRVVGSRVWPHGTEVRIIAVDDGSPAMATRHKDELPLAAERMVEWAEDALGVIGLRVAVVTGKGDPQRVLIEQAEAWDADSIFVGGRRFSGALERFQLGSVATALVTNAHCSVEVVRDRAINES